MKRQPGTYALIMSSGTRADIQIGRWGRLAIYPAYYIYVGSAFGPGGLKARVSRHFRETKSKHWHIDYLREFVSPVCAWTCCEPVNLEHRWAQSVSQMTDTSSVKGFGCSDCKCYTHLFTTATKPDLGQFSKVIGDAVELWPYQVAG
jgi:Uri superfamily endonuclease